MTDNNLAAPLTKRAQQIAAIHALADWFAEHPEVPMPYSMSMTALISRTDVPDEADRAAQVKRWAADNDASFHESAHAWTAELTVMSTETAGMDAFYGLYGTRD